MGCDIHVYCEKQKSDGTWINVDNWKLDEYLEKGKPEIERGLEINPIYSGRNYSLFATLANVRNDGTVDPIAIARGLPNNIAHKTKCEAERWGSDGHSHSYLTMRELVEAQKQITHKKFKGMVSPEGAAAIDRGEMPDVWCGWTSNKSWIQKEWIQPGSHLESFMAKLTPFYKEKFWIYGDDDEAFGKNLDRFRIVFWFDN